MYTDEFISLSVGDLSIQEIDLTNIAKLQARTRDLRRCVHTRYGVRPLNKFDL